MKKSFGQFMITYLLFFACFIGVLIPAYIYLYTVYMDKCIEENQEKLKNGLNSFALDINRLSVFVQNMRGDSKYTRLSYLDNPMLSKHYYWMESARQEINTNLGAYTTLTDTLVDFGILYQNGICVTMRRSFTALNALYGNFLSCDNMKAQEWASSLSSNTNSMGLMQAHPYHSLDNEHFSGITMVRKLSDPGIAQDAQIVFFILDAENILEKMSSREMLTDRIVTLYDFEGNILAVEGSFKENLEYKSIEYANAAGGMRARVDIPSSFIKAKMKPVRLMIFESLSFFLVVGICLAFLFSHKNSKPIKEIMNQLNIHCRSARTSQDSSEYKCIAQFIENMDSEFLHMKDTLIEQEQMLRAGTLERLIHGLVRTQEEMQQARTLFQHFPENYCVCIVKISEPENSNDSMLHSKRTMTVERLRANLPRDIEIHFIDLDSILVILPLCPAQFAIPQNYGKVLRSTCQQLYMEHETQALFAVSNLFSSMESLPIACREARHILRRVTIDLGQSVFFKADMPDGKGWMPIEFTDIQHFHEILISGVEKNAEGFIRLVFSTIRKKGYVDDIYIQQVFLSFRQVFNRVRYEIPDTKINDLESLAYSEFDSLDNLIEKLVNCSRQICRCIQDANMQKKKGYISSLINYIQSNLSEPNLYAKSVADKFNISERSLHALMRNETGKSFFEYVETKRMDMAYHLLMDTNMAIIDVSTSCGYELPNSFYKAFKRRYGIAPSALRETSFIHKLDNLHIV